jgi:hypothetical protein
VTDGLTGEAGVNLAGVEITLRLMDEIAQMQAEIVALQQRFESEVASLKSRLGQVE